MIKPIPTINHKAGKRSTVYYDDYKRLEKYCEQIQAEKVALANQVGKEHRHSELFSEVDKLSQESTVLNVGGKKVEVFMLANLFKGEL